MALQISDTTPRVQYTATSGQTTFAVNFEFFNVADLKVYNGTTLLTYNNSPSSASQYSVTGAGVTGGGSITLGSPGATLNDKITIVRDLAIERISDFPVSGNFPIQTLNTELDKIVAMLQQLEEQFARTLQYPVTTTTGFNVDLPDLVANRVLSVNADATALLANQELGTFKGNWAASTSYQIRDLVKDTSTGNIFFVNAAHTSSGSEPLTTNANSAKYDLIVDAASATTSATNAASSATAASTSATAAANSATAAATSETNAATSESNASTSESNASTSATNASNSATAAATSATNAATSETNAATSATNAATSETNASTSATNAASSATSAAGSATTATTQASAASTSATNAATSETNAATSASNASTSETNAANSATSAATSATNANTSATNASNSASAAAASAASAANSYDQFDDRYLGTKTSDPTLDNDGNALVAGALYFNSNANEMRVYDGGNWIPASSAGTASLILYEYTATSGQTTFSGTDDNSATLSYSVDNLQVVLNGVILDPSDYTATSGTSIVLGSGAATGDLLNVYAFKSFTVSELNANNLNDGIVPIARLGTSGTKDATTFLRGDNTFATVTSTTINNNADNRVITGSATANTLEGEANLTFDGNTLNVSPNSGYLRIKAGTTDATNNVRLEAGGTVNTYLEYRGYLGHIFDVDNTEKMRINSSGVDVRTTTSGAESKLRVSSNNATGDNDATVVISNSGSGDAMLRFDYEESNTDRARIGVTSSGQQLKFYTAGNNERMQIDSSGNVGIGDTSPLGKVHVNTGGSATSVNANADELVLEGSGNSGMTIISGNTSTSTIFMTDPDDTNIGALYYDHSTNEMQFRVNDNIRCKIDSSGHFLPQVSNTYDLGSTSLVWRNIYTSDLHMSNENLDKGNDVDGTKGSWTFQEGADDLFLLNNKNGKKYKFNLTEIE